MFQWHENQKRRDRSENLTQYSPFHSWTLGCWPCLEGRQLLYLVGVLRVVVDITLSAAGFVMGILAEYFVSVMRPIVLLMSIVHK